MMGVQICMYLHDQSCWRYCVGSMHGLNIVNGHPGSCVCVVAIILRDDKIVKELYSVARGTIYCTSS